MKIDLLDEQELVSYFLVLCRISGIVFMLPGTSYIPIRIKLLLALFISIIITPMISDYFNDFDYSKIFFHIIQEAIIGIFIGLLINIIINSVNIAGNIIAAQIGLSSVVNFDKNIGEQNVILGKFFTMTVMAYLFATDHHFSIIVYLLKSYYVLNSIIEEDFLLMIVKIMQESFDIAIKISSAISIISISSYLTVCLLGRLVPQIQFFFIAMPIQIWIGLLIIVLTLHLIIVWFVDIKIV